MPYPLCLTGISQHTLGSAVERRTNCGGGALVEGCGLRRPPHGWRGPDDRREVAAASALPSTRTSTVRVLNCRRIVRRNLVASSTRSRSVDSRRHQKWRVDVWTWMAIDPDTSRWCRRGVSLTRHRDRDFMHDLADPLRPCRSRRRPPPVPVESRSIVVIEYAMLIEIYADPEAEKRTHRPVPRRQGRYGRAEPEHDQHVLRRTSEPHDADVDAEIHAVRPDQQESRDARRTGGAAFHALQFLENSPRERHPQATA